MDMMSTGRFALRLRAPAWRVKRLATLLFTLLLLSYHWGLPTYSATSSLPAPQRNADAQAANALTPQLFYPAVYYGYRDSGRTWNSTLTVQNHANTSATVELVFYNENGQAATPSSFPTTGNNTIQNPVTLPAGGAATVRIDAQSFISGLSQNSRYAVVVNSDQPLVGVNWVRVAGSGNESHGAYQGVTVGSRGPIYLPAVAYAVDNFTSNLAIQNLSNSTLTGVTLNFYNQNGNQAGQPNTAVPPIPAYATAFIHLGGFSMPGVFSGAVVVNSPNGPVAVVDNKIGGANGYTLFSDNGITSAGNTRYAPFLTTESGASATVTIQNTSNNQAATVTVTNSDNVGNTQLNLPPRGSQTVSYSTGSHSRPFAATISANQPVVAAAAVENTIGRAYAYHAAAQGATTYRLPLMVTNYQNSGSNAVFNTNTIAKMREKRSFRVR
jgi:hypothetical protein